MAEEAKVKIAKVALARIRWDAGTQMRVSMNEEYVQELAEALKRGDPIPPAICFYDGTNLWLADGFHRFYAATEAEEERLLCEIRAGSLDDAILFAAGCNKNHGLRRTNWDKRNAVLMILRSAVWGDMSARQIATHCGVDDTFVGDMRRQYDANPQQEDEPLSGPVVTSEHMEEVEQGNDAGAVKPHLSEVPETSIEPPATPKAQKVKGKDGKQYERSKRPTDQLGNELHQRLIPIFEEVPKFKALVASLGRELGAIRKLVDSSSGAGRALDIASIEGKVQSIQENLNVSAPYCMCPSCYGKGCGTCKASGWLTKFAYKFVPAGQQWSEEK